MPQCEICRWWPDCDRRRRDDDHLCLVAGISKLQISELHDWGVATLADLAELPLPLAASPRGAPRTATSGCASRRGSSSRVAAAEAPVYELLPVVEAQGLCRLPAPSPGDVFLDFEGDPFVGAGGLEYLFGWTIGAGRQRPTTISRWALDPTAERAAFEAFIDLVMARWERWPDLHIYHFAAYEPAALKRLMGRYATREDELDRLLRAGRFVDLHAVVAAGAARQRRALLAEGARAVFYGFERAIDLRTRLAASARRSSAPWSSARHDAVPQATRRAIEAYNRDDCLSTRGCATGSSSCAPARSPPARAIARPEPASGAPPEALERAPAARRRSCTSGSPATSRRTRRSAATEQQARWLLANMLDWHRREEKAVWWEYFRLCELPDEDLLEEKAALSGLEFVERDRDAEAGASVDRYRFPPQECEIREGDELASPSGKRSARSKRSIVAACTVDIKKGPGVAEPPSGSVFAHSDIDDGRQARGADAARRMGRRARDRRRRAPSAPAATCCFAEPPRHRRQTLSPARTQTGRRAQLGRWRSIDGVLPIQGPPGAGKTYTGARMIMCAGARRQEGRRHRDQPQGDPQPARRGGQGGAEEDTPVRASRR